MVSSLASNNDERAPSIDLSLASAVKRHVRVDYEQANQNQRRAAKLLGISRSTLARHRRGLAQEQSIVGIKMSSSGLRINSDILSVCNRNPNF